VKGKYNLLSWDTDVYQAIRNALLGAIMLDPNFSFLDVNMQDTSMNTMTTIPSYC